MYRIYLLIVVEKRMSEEGGALRQLLWEAKEAGDIDIRTYLAELKKLRSKDRPSTSAGAVNEDESASCDDDDEPSAKRSRDARGSDSDDSEEDEDRHSRSQTARGEEPESLQDLLGLSDDVDFGLETPSKEPAVARTLPTEQPAWLPGMVAKHVDKGNVTVVRVGVASDFVNCGRVYIKATRVKKNCKFATEVVHFWVLQETLCPLEVEQEVTELSPRRSPRIAAAQGGGEVNQDLPALAEHERARKLKQKPDAPVQGHREPGATKTSESKVPLEKRLLQFPDQSFIIRFDELRCLACKKRVFNKHSSITQHIFGSGHVASLLAWKNRKLEDKELRDDLLAYYKENKSEAMSNVHPDEMVYRYRTSEAMLASGTPFTVCDVMRPLLERAGVALTDSSHMKVYIPKIEKTEISLIIAELGNEHVFISFDGTTRLGEAINVVGRYCTKDFNLSCRLLDFTTLLKHVKQVGLAAYVSDLLQRQRSIPAFNVIGFGRDSVSVNGAACRRLRNIFTAAVDMLCVCHTLCHVGERFELPTLDDFMTPWLELVGGRDPHAGAKLLWKETVHPATVPGFSNVRWYAKAEIIFVIGEAGSRRLRDFLVELEQREYGQATTRKMLNIVNTKGMMLRLEVAAMLDMRSLVRTTYEMEGDRLEILLCYERIEALRAMGVSLKARADGCLPNVDAVLRLLMELKKGTRIEKYFQGHGTVSGKLEKKENVNSTLYPDQERDAWLVKYPDGFTEHFEIEELRSGKEGPIPHGCDGKPILVVRDLPERVAICDGLAKGFEYLEARITGTCDAQYSCVETYKICSLVRAFDPNFAAASVTEEYVESLKAITPLAALNLIADLKAQLPGYLRAAAGAPAFDRSDVEAYSDAVLTWWRTNGSLFQAWATAARICFAISPNSACCERVFSMLKNMFGDQQLSALADYIRAALMLKYNKRVVG